MSLELYDNRVHAITLPPLALETSVAPSPRADWSLLHDINVDVSVRLGLARLRLKDLLGLKPGNVIMLDTALDTDVGVLVDGHVIAQGALIAQERRFGVRITATAEN